MKQEELNIALHVAASEGDAVKVGELIAAGAYVHAGQDVALRAAARRGHLEVVELLLQAGADVHAKDNIALRWAAEGGRYAVVECLLQSSPNVCVYDDRPLRNTMKGGHIHLLNLLLANGADPGHPVLVEAIQTQPAVRAWFEHRALQKNIESQSAAQATVVQANVVPASSLLRRPQL